ncbi:hypothetical protein Tco_0326840 [Tanacetum coccineum]
MGEWVGRGGRGRRPREGNDERVEDLNGQGNDQGLGANRGVEGVNGNARGAKGVAPEFAMIIARKKLQNPLTDMLAQENVGNVLVNGNRVGCSYKEFLACNPKEYDGKGGVVVLTRWIEKMENLARLVPYLVTPKGRMIEMYVYGLAYKPWRLVAAATRAKTMQEAVQIVGALTDEDCRGVLRNVNPVNARNPTISHVISVVFNRPWSLETKGIQARVWEQRKSAGGLNIVDGTFTLNDHFDTALFDSDADYSFISTTFIPLLGLEPSDLGFRYEIEIASMQACRIDKMVVMSHYEWQGALSSRRRDRKVESEKEIVDEGKASDKKQEDIVVVYDIFSEDIPG